MNTEKKRRGFWNRVSMGACGGMMVKLAVLLLCKVWDTTTQNGWNDLYAGNVILAIFLGIFGVLMSIVAFDPHE